MCAEQEPIEVVEYGEYTIKVFPDSQCEDPFKDWNHVKTFGINMTNHSDYKEAILEDCPINVPHFIYTYFHGGVTPEEKMFERQYHWEFVYMHDHGGRTVNTTGFSSPWDSGIAGIAYISKQELIDEGMDGITRHTKAADRAAAASAYLAQQVKLLDSYISGAVYGFTVVKTAEPDEAVDSCWGFFEDVDYVIEQAKLELPEPVANKSM